MSFVHLHVHTNFSFGDGAGRIDELVGAAQRLGMPALAITDHDGLYGAVRFYQACKAAGVKPIVGVEISVESVLAPPAVTAETTDDDPTSVPPASAAPSPAPHPRLPHPRSWSSGRCGIRRNRGGSHGSRRRRCASLGRAGEGGAGGEGEL